MPKTPTPAATPSASPCSPSGSRREFGLNADQVERLYMAGILHDVGKIGVPEAVLHKAGKLTAEEFDQMKKHPQIGGADPVGH